MRVFIFATASLALALEEADHADVEEHLSLLQLSAKPRSVAENSDDLDAYVGDLDLDLERGTPYTWAAPADLRRGFGPDGTWATPHCKHIQGCLKEERSCPAGCNGAAYWEWTNPANSRLGVPNSMGASKGARMHYLGCQQGMNRGGAIGSFSFHDCYMNCFNGPDSDKPAITSSDPAWPAQNKINMQGIDPSQTFYQNEFCPADCVNDCAFFKLGQFLGCGFIPPPIMSTRGRPSAYCPVGKIGALQQFGAVGASSWTWCGEPTTTTTTTPPPPPPPPVEEPVDGDEAAAEADPHLASSTGSHKDLCCEGGVCRPCENLLQFQEVKGNDLTARAAPDGATNIEFVDRGAGAFAEDGRLTAVRFYVQRAGNLGLRFRIYRPAGGGFSLVGQTEAIEVPQSSVVQEVSFSEPVEYLAGDYIGWAHDGNGNIPYDNGGGRVSWEYSKNSAVGVARGFGSGGARTYSYEVTTSSKDDEGAATGDPHVAYGGHVWDVSETDVHH